MAAGRPSASSAQQAVITVDAATRHQVMTGWEAVAEIGDVDLIDTFESWRDAALDAAAEANINRLRVSVPSGAEAPVDYFTQYEQGLITRPQYNGHRFEAVNDNSSPNTIDPAGFHFAELDHRIDNVVAPLRQRLAARGKSLYVMLQFQDASDGQPHPFEHSSAPAEYAEFVLATYQHLQERYGWIPDAFSIQNEPNNRGFWTPLKLANAIVATGNRLVAAGFPKPEIVAPDCSGTDSALEFLDAMINVPGVRTYLSEFSYHRYRVSHADLESIAARAAQYELRTAMLEHIRSPHTDLHEDLTLVGVSAWEQYTLAYPSGDNGGHYFSIDLDDPQNPRVEIGSRTKFLRQYFKYVDVNAVRIGAQTDDAAFDPVAFVNPDDSQVVVVKASHGGTFSVLGLPAATYGIKYTTDADYDVDQPDVALPAGQTLMSAIPAAGVLTIYRKGALPPSPSPTPSRTSTGTRTRTGTMTATATRTRTRTATATATTTVTRAATPTPTGTRTRTATATATASCTSTVTPSRTPTATPSDVVSTATASALSTPSVTSSHTAAPTGTGSPAPTSTPPAPTPTPSVSPTAVPSPTDTPTAVRGDLTGDGRVTTEDLDALLAALFSPSAPAASDLNGDGATTSADIPELVELLETDEGTAGCADPSPADAPEPPAH